MKYKTCNMPGCKKVATESWALVPICCHCHDELRAETQKYYAKRLYGERVLHKKLKAVKKNDRVYSIR